MVPLWPKLIISLGAAALTAACYISVFFTSFASFSVAQSIEDELGSAINIVVMPWGWLVIGCFVGGARSRQTGMRTSSLRAWDTAPRWPDLQRE